MQARHRSSLRGSFSSALMLACALAAAGCGGDSEAEGSSSKSAATESGAAGGGLSGLWIDDKQIYVHFADDGRYAAFSASQAADEIRYFPCGQNEYGERTLPTLNQAAGWELERDLLVSYKRPLDPAKKSERIAGRTFHRPDAEQRMTYWEARATRFVRDGDLKQIREAEAGGFDFSTIPDLTVTAAAEGERIHLDMLGWAVKNRQREVADHFLDRGFDVASSDAIVEAAELNDFAWVESLLARVPAAPGQDPAQRSPLDAAIASDQPLELFAYLFEHGAKPEARHLALVDASMPKNGAAVKAWFEARLAK